MGNPSRQRELALLKQRVVALDSQTIDELYGLEPVFDPASGDSTGSLGEYVEFLCPWCCEATGTTVDVTGGSRRCVEDCQVCCAPMELAIEVDPQGRLQGVSVQR